jgi:hypothetical protein
MLNKEQTKYPCEVISNSDPLQLGRVKVNCPPLMHGWKSSDYPWAFQAKSGTGGSNDFGTSEIPEVGTYVWAWHEKANYKNWFYGEDVHWYSGTKQISPHLLFIQYVKSIISSIASYPDVKYKYYKNGICTGVSSSSSAKEAFLYHPSGTYVMVENDGTLNAVMATGKPFKVNGDVKVTGKVTATGNIESDAEVKAMAASPATSVGLSTHIQASSGAPGTPTSGPQPGT